MPRRVQKYENVLLLIFTQIMSGIGDTLAVEEAEKNEASLVMPIARLTKDTSVQMILGLKYNDKNN